MRITLSDDELVEVTGYKQPASQLRALHDRGFLLARRSTVTGKVILDRAHYEAVCNGFNAQTKRPSLRA